MPSSSANNGDVFSALRRDGKPLLCSFPTSSAASEHFPLPGSVCPGNPSAAPLPVFTWLSVLLSFSACSYFPFSLLQLSYSHHGKLIQIACLSVIFFLFTTMCMPPSAFQRPGHPGKNKIFFPNFLDIGYFNSEARPKESSPLQHPRAWSTFYSGKGGEYHCSVPRLRQELDCDRRAPFWPLGFFPVQGRVIWLQYGTTGMLN